MRTPNEITILGKVRCGRCHDVLPIKHGVIFGPYTKGQIDITIPPEAVTTIITGINMSDSLGNLYWLQENELWLKGPYGSQKAIEAAYRLVANASERSAILKVFVVKRTVNSILELRKHEMSVENSSHLSFDELF